MSDRPFKVHIHFWAYLFGAIPAGWLLSQMIGISLYPINLYSLMALIIITLSLFLIIVSVRGFVQFGPILEVSDRGLYIGAPFCNVGWLDWRDILRVGLDKEILLIDLSKHRPKKSLPRFVRFMQGINQFGSQADLAIPLTLRRGVRVDQIVEQIESRLISERFS